MNINTKIQKLKIHLLGLLSLGACLACGYAFGLRPVWQVLEAQRQTAVEVTHLLELVPSLEQELAQLKTTISAQQSELRQRYPISIHPDQPLLGTLAQMLASRHISLINLREEAHPSDASVTIVLQTSSDYADMIHFIHDLRQLDRPARITQLSLAPTDPLGERCTAKITVRFSPAINLPETT
jgi:hypothetical protein